MKIRALEYSTEGQTSLAWQVRQFQEHFPELYDYLTQRDREIEHALARAPNWADIELSSVVGTRGYLEKALRGLPPGIAELCKKEAERA
ncbi:MAG: hypothetical protein ACOC9Y_02530 [Chloroflexota bacterium]